MTELMISEGRKEVQDLKFWNRASRWLPRTTVLFVIAVVNFLIQALDASSFSPFYSTIVSVLTAIPAVLFYLQRSSCSLPSWIVDRIPEILQLIRTHNEAARGFTSLLQAQALAHGENPEIVRDLKRQKNFLELRKVRLERALAFLEALKGCVDSTLDRFESALPPTTFGPKELQQAFEALLDACQIKPEEVSLLMDPENRSLDFTRSDVTQLRAVLRTERSLLRGQTLLHLADDLDSDDADEPDEPK